MKALVFHRPGHVEVNTVDDPKIEHAEDVILRVTSTAICGSDLHILNGFIPQKTTSSSVMNSWGSLRKPDAA